MDLTVGRIVWARYTKDDIYWPGKIIIVSNNTNDLWSSESYKYLIEFFVTNQSNWITDILPYRQYRDSMTNDSFMTYGLHSTMKPDFLNAINQADYASSHEMYVNSSNLTVMTTQQQTNFTPTIENNIDNDFLLESNSMFTSNTGCYNTPYQQPGLSLNSTNQLTDTFQSNNNSNKSNQVLTTNNDWYAQQGLLVESITPPLPLQHEHISSIDTFEKIHTVIILTTKNYANSSFISFIFNSLSNFFHSSIVYIDHLTNYQHPTTSTISYLICFDHFDLTIKQTLNSTILNNLNAHINYLFLIINTPSQELITHFYSTIMNKRSILVLHYHYSTFDNEPLLLCSGNRKTYEMIRLSFLKYLCLKIKYIESREDKEEERLYSSYYISSLVQSTNILNRFVNEQIQQTLNQNFELDFIRNNQAVIDELFPRIVINKNSNSNNLFDIMHNSNEDILKDKAKQSTIMNDLFQNRAIKTNILPPICTYYKQNILHE